MEKYNFDEIIDRRGTDSLKWAVGENELPMWVADMDFYTCPAVTEAIKRKTSEGIFGYCNITEDWYEAYETWWRERHGFPLKREWLLFCTGVIPAISSIIRKVTNVGEKVLIQSPVYNVFFRTVRDNGRQLLDNPLVLRDDEYSMDFGDLEEKLSDPETTLMILCNPQNPSGKVWEKETLQRIGELCKKYHVTVLSDEIHCDLTEPGIDYVPFASVSEDCLNVSITTISATKAFNAAGLKSAAVVISDPVLRHKVQKAMKTDEISEPNAFSVPGTVAAFKEGGPWLNSLRQYISENKAEARLFIEKELPQISCIKGDSTYLIWLDVRKVCEDSKRLSAFIREKTGLFISEGSMYGGTGFFRMNLACPKSVLRDGLERLKAGLQEFASE